ncbi:MAG: WecB/TagA/CpsF family glycosyltransferase [Muribaculaceae bacterium]|nr:WecB/TagA/CpsF family glycosyltransferase [Muribaculaceae bacterium]
MKHKLLNISIDRITTEQLLNDLTEGVLLTPNLDHMVNLQHNRELYDAYCTADWVVCDSRILYFLSKTTKKPLPETIPGSSFFREFYLYHKDDPDCKILLLGAKPGVADQAMENINKTCGRKIVVGAHSPSFGFEKNEEENNAIIEIIKQSNANVVLVGVGSPKQELWIMRHKNRLPQVKIWLPLGATIDFESGQLKRAPRIVQRIGMEWLYRVIKEPKRLFKRYFVDDMKFFIYYLKFRLNLYKNPFQS